MIIIITRNKNTLNEKRHYDSTKKERNKKKHSAGWSTPFHRVRPVTQKSYTGQGTLWIRWCQPTVFLVSFLFGRIIVTFFIGNVFISCLNTFCFYVFIKIYIIFFLYRLFRFHSQDSDVMSVATILTGSVGSCMILASQGPGWCPIMTRPCYLCWHIVK